MHQPRPYGLHAIGLPLTDRDEAFIASVTKRITNLKKLSNADSLKMVYDLPDGGYVIVQDVGGNFRVIAHKPVYSKDVVFDGLATNYIPMLFSGVVTKAILPEHHGLGLNLSESARNRIRQYKQDKPMPATTVSLQRFRIGYADRFQEFKPVKESAFFRTQYDKLRATWYSGAMAEVVQIVGGYGKQDMSTLPDDSVERATMILPKEVYDQVESELENIRLPGFTGTPNAEGFIQYDYKFNHTNAVSFDEAGKPWLVRIDSSGVWTMPLPVIPATTTKAFRRYMEKVGDDEIIALLDRFGGMPSGETFPSGGKSFEAWRRAGVIIKVCDTSNFYEHIAYSSAMGWSLNSKGSEGYNTCYDYNDNEGLGYGLTYKVRLAFGAAENHNGETAEDISKMLPERAERVRRYLTQLTSKLDAGTNETRAILYKLRRVGLYVIHDRSLVRNGEWDLEYWNNLELDPIAIHEGSVNHVSVGYLYHGAPFKSQPQIKFPEPLTGYCMSHDFLPLKNGRYKDSYPNSDTIMLAYFVKNELKVIKYFVDWNSFTRKSENNYEKNMYVGSWQSVDTIGPTSIQGFFYGTDIDDREYVAPTITTTKIKGEDLGFDSKPRFLQDFVFSMTGTLYRFRFHSRQTTVNRVQGKRIHLSVCVPYFCRSAAVYAKKETIESEYNSDGMGMYSVADPTSYRYWTYDFVFAWTNMTIKNPKGQPYPKNGAPVFVEEENYAPNDGSDFADNGSWISGLPADYTWLIHPNQGEWLASGGGSAPTIKEYSTNNTVTNKEWGSVSVSMIGRSGVVNEKLPEKGYFMSSPTEFGDMFYIDATYNVFGNTTYSNVSESGQYGGRAYYGSSKLADHSSAHCFIGVINE